MNDHATELDRFIDALHALRDMDANLLKQKLIFAHLSGMQVDANTDFSSIPAGNPLELRCLEIRRTLECIFSSYYSEEFEMPQTVLHVTSLVCVAKLLQDFQNDETFSASITSFMLFKCSTLTSKIHFASLRFL